VAKSGIAPAWLAGDCGFKSRLVHTVLSQLYLLACMGGLEELLSELRVEDTKAWREMFHTVFPDFTLESHLGKGASGTVYLAVRKIGTKSVPHAMKFIFGKSDEAERAYELNHEHILGVRNIGSVLGTQVIVTDYADEGSLLDKIKKNGRIDTDEALSVALGVAKALSYAHERNIVHRDVKPSNILFSKGVVKLADFSVSGGPHDEFVCGTPGYLAPELLRDDTEPIREREQYKADIYALGSVLLEMLNGKPLHSLTKFRQLLPEGHFHIDTIKQHYDWLIQQHACGFELPLDNIDARVQPLLSDMLDTDPNSRLSAAQVVDRIEALYDRNKKRTFITNMSRGLSACLLVSLIGTSVFTQSTRTMPRSVDDLTASIPSSEFFTSEGIDYAGMLHRIIDTKIEPLIVRTATAQVPYIVVHDNWVFAHNNYWWSSVGVKVSDLVHRVKGSDPDKFDFFTDAREREEALGLPRLHENAKSLRRFAYVANMRALNLAREGFLHRYDPELKFINFADIYTSPTNRFAPFPGETLKSDVKIIDASSLYDVTPVLWQSALRDNIADVQYAIDHVEAVRRFCIDPDGRVAEVARINVHEQLWTHHKVRGFSDNSCLTQDLAFVYFGLVNSAMSLETYLQEHCASNDEHAGYVEQWLASADNVLSFYIDNLPPDKVPEYDMLLPDHIKDRPRNTGAALMMINGMLTHAELLGSDGQHLRKKAEKLLEPIIRSHLCLSTDTDGLVTDVWVNPDALTNRTRSYFADFLALRALEQLSYTDQAPRAHAYSQ